MTADQSHFAVSTPNIFVRVIILFINDASVKEAITEMFPEKPQIKIFIILRA